MLHGCPPLYLLQTANQAKLTPSTMSEPITQKNLTPPRTQVHYRDRRTGEIRVEQIPAETALRFFYESRLGILFRNLFFGNGTLSCLYGWWQNRSRTHRQIRPFIERFQIDLNEIELSLDQYPTFNAFFARRLKPEARPFTSDPAALCSPADGKILVFPELTPETEFPIKGSSVSPATLLASGEEAGPFAGGAALIIRLAPPDYHRFHFFDNGVAETARLIPGKYHSVNPIAQNRVPDLFHLNRRAVTLIDTERFGRLAYVEIGAFAVASIVQTYTPGPVRRGQEKGYFQFGGSTLALLFEPGRILFDEDLVFDSEKGLETQIQTGSRIGTNQG